MSADTPPRLTLELPPLTLAQADPVCHLLCALHDAFWTAYNNELLEIAAEASAAAQDVCEQDPADEEAFWDLLLSP